MTLLSDADGTAAGMPREDVSFSVPFGVLTPEQREKRDRCEAIVDKSLGTFVEVGEALKELRDGKLYLETHTTFEAYCSDRFGFERAHAYRLIAAAELVASLSPMGDKPSTERQVRPLLTVPPERRQEAWDRAVSTAPKGKLTAAHVESVASTYRPECKTETPWDIVAAAVQLDRLIARTIEDWPAEHHVALAVQLRVHANHIDGRSITTQDEPRIPATPVIQAECRPFTYGSVCSGIEAATIAWHPLGWRPKWFAEIAEFPSAVLAHRHPDVPNLGDFSTIGEDHGPIDLLVGGTPCQAFSVTGLRGGLADERGNLALEYLRLAQRLCPRWLVWENVCGVLSSLSHDAPDLRPPDIDLDSGNGPADGEKVVVEDEYDADESHAFACFLAGLSELGYGWAYRVLDAQYFGIAQRRKRVFVVGYLGDVRPAIYALFERESLSENPGTTREKRKATARQAGCHVPSLFGEADDDRAGDERPLIYGWNGDEEFKYAEAISTTLRAAQGGEGNGFATDDEVRCFTAIERERLMGFPDDYTKIPYRGQPAERCPDNARAHALGNSMAVPCMAWIGRRIDSIRSLIPHHRGQENALRTQEA
jgi:DNA (cytosine-5)-methyltransferase 1